jgi:tetratricopeptide (TPR) repeat protein
MRRTVELLDGTRPQLLETVDWLMQREAWNVVDETAKRFAAQFDGDAVLLYRLAESQHKQGQAEQAEALALRALELQGADPDSHVITAVSLQGRGMFAWAEREYQHVMSVEKIGSLSDLRARFLLSEMQHDIGDDSKAAEVLRKAVDAMDADPAVLETVENRFGRDPGSIRSRMHYFYARRALESGDRVKHVEHLQEGVKNDPTDADVLIAMYRVPQPDAEFRKLTIDRIDAAVGKFRTEVKEFQLEADGAQSEALRAWANRQLATSYNQLAWLVGNTEGDFDEAVQSSHRSLELRPDTGGYYDTLGRCYFARSRAAKSADDLEKAIKYQRKAVELEPFSGQIRRQLAEFEQAQAAPAEK